MKKEVEFVKVVDDYDGKIAEWIACSLGVGLEELDVQDTIGFVRQQRVIGGVIYGGYRKKRDVWLTIYSNDKKWCCRRILKIVFGFVFEALECKRANVLVEADNLPSLSLVKRLGFVEEGKLRGFSERGKDMYVLGMLKSECEFLEKKEKKNVY